MCVAERPVLLPLYLPGESVDQGSYVQLTCIATAGDLPIDFQWSLNGRRLSESSALVTRVSPQTSLLILSAVALDQAGNYSCDVTNPAGRASSTIQVKVNGKKRYTERKKSIKNKHHLKKEREQVLANSNRANFIFPFQSKRNERTVSEINKTIHKGRDAERT